MKHRRSQTPVALSLLVVLLTGCPGRNSLVIDLGGRDEPAPVATAAALAPAAQTEPASTPAAAEQEPPEPVPAYWMLRSEWRSMHQHAIRRLGDTRFSTASLEELIRETALAMREIGKRLNARDRAALDPFSARYDTLATLARNRGDRQVLALELTRLGNDIEARIPRR